MSTITPIVNAPSGIAGVTFSATLVETGFVTPRDLQGDADGNVNIPIGESAEPNGASSCINLTFSSTTNLAITNVTRTTNAGNFSNSDIIYFGGNNYVLTDPNSVFTNLGSNEFRPNSNITSDPSWTFSLGGTSISVCSKRDVSSATNNNRFAVKLAIVSPTNPLPVQLEYFRVSSSKNNSNVLEWKTSSETNNNYFEVEKSVDAKKWQVIGKIDGIGTSNEGSLYKFTDNKPFKKAYYRLKQYDFNGKVHLSEISYLERNDLPDHVAVKLIDDRTLSFVNQTEQPAHLLMTTIKGVNCLSVQLNRLGESKLMDVSSLASGIYIITNSETGESKKIVLIT